MPTEIWTPVGGESLPESWTPVSGGSTAGGIGIPEAPVDGQQYARSNADWEVVEGVPGPPGEPGTPGTDGTGGVNVIVSEIYPPPEPGEDGFIWYDPSSGTILVWYAGAWQPFGVPAPSSPTPIVGQQMRASLGPVNVQIKEFDLPFLDDAGGNSYYARFSNAFAAGWADPSFFPIAVWLSPGQAPHAANAASANLTFYQTIERNSGNITYVLEAGLSVWPQIGEWDPTTVEAESGGDPRVVAWNITDEPDMFGSLEQVQIGVTNVRLLNDGRFAGLNIGAGVTGNPLWQPLFVPAMVQAVDVCGTDQYNYSGTAYSVATSPHWPLDPTPESARRAATYGWLADRMRLYQQPANRKPYGVCVEVANAFNASDPNMPFISIPEMAGAVWSPIIHGATMITWFQHNASYVHPQPYGDPTIGFYSLTDGGARHAAVAAINAEVRSLAPVINSPTYIWDFGDVNVDTMLKAYDGDAYIFAMPSLYSPFPGRGSSEVERVGVVLEFASTSTTETGTVSSTIVVPDGVELVVVTVSGRHGTNAGFASMTFTKSATDTAMTKAAGNADANGSVWQSAVFYMVLPDPGTCTLKWDWLGASIAGPKLFSVSMWGGVDLANPVRDAEGVQGTGVNLTTSTLSAFNGDKVFCHVGMYNSGGGRANIDAWHHMTKLWQLEPSGVAGAGIATADPDGNLEIGFTQFTSVTQAAMSTIVIRGIVITTTTTTITQIGSTFNSGTGGVSANTGTFYAPVPVPTGTELVLCGIGGTIPIAGGFESLTMLKGGVQTPMIKVPGGDIAIDGWQGTLFYMVNPDIGTSPVLWNWTGSTEGALAMGSFTFWAGVDLTDPIRSFAAAQPRQIFSTPPFPTETAKLTNREGDLIVAWFTGYTGGVEATVNEWTRLTLLDELLHNGYFDGAWATSVFNGSTKVGIVSAPLFQSGSLTAVVLKPAEEPEPGDPPPDPTPVARSVITGTFTLPPDLAATTTVEVLNESRSISVTAGVFEDDFDEEFSHHIYRIVGA